MSRQRQSLARAAESYSSRRDELLDRQHINACCGELDSQWDAPSRSRQISTTAAECCVGSVRSGTTAAARSRNKTASTKTDRPVHWEEIVGGSRHVVARDRKRARYWWPGCALPGRCVAGRAQLVCWTRCSQLSSTRRTGSRREKVGVSEQVANGPRQRARRGARHRLRHMATICERRKVYDPYAVAIGAHQVGRDPQR